MMRAFAMIVVTGTWAFNFVYKDGFTGDGDGIFTATKLKGVK